MIRHNINKEQKKENRIRKYFVCIYNKDQRIEKYINYKCKN